MYLATVFRLLIIWGPKPPGRQVSMPMTMKQEVCFRDPLHLKKNLCFLDKTSHEWRPFEMDYNEKPALTKTLVTKLALDLKLRLQLLFWKSADDLYTILVFKDMKNVDQFFASNSLDRLITVFRTRFKDVMVNFDRIIHTKGSSKTLVRHVIAVQESHFEEMARSNMVTENGYMLYLLSASDPTDTKWNFEITKKMVDDNPTLRSIRTDFTNFLDKEREASLLSPQCLLQTICYREEKACL
ncbi:unnamed protein product [Peronospora belbahrii]|uniref:Uncharacterized protein n=1 Tax=Peronospora belbahrii TaxID=622444 RepID=A0AAU9LB47_9STRA|nr:unnamed protein product [Peronospora belbahrii]